jgi:hypothetical protein
LGSGGVTVRELASEVNEWIVKKKKEKKIKKKKNLKQCKHNVYLIPKQIILVLNTKMTSFWWI